MISGELRGEELYKFNGEVLQEWNDSALVPCENCKRTFLPSSLVSHQRSCTQHNPMVKPSKEQSYTARANAKVSEYNYRANIDFIYRVNLQVSYPKLKNDKAKVKLESEPDFEATRPGTYVVTEAGEERKEREREREAPTRQDIAQIINNSPALARPQLRRELREIIETFINKHSSPVS